MTFAGPPQPTISNAIKPASASAAPAQWVRLLTGSRNFLNINILFYFYSGAERRTEHFPQFVHEAPVLPMGELCLHRRGWRLEKRNSSAQWFCCHYDQ